MERYLTDGTSLFLTLRWSDIDDISDEDVWDTLRSHEPVHADGVTPFIGYQELRDISGVSLTAGLRYEFKLADLRRIRLSRLSASTISPMMADSG